jgi:hypothetical protein
VEVEGAREEMERMRLGIFGGAVVGTGWWEVGVGV